PVQRHIHRADLRDGVKRFEKLCAIRHQQADAIAQRHAGCAQCIRDLVAARVEIAKIQAPSASGRFHSGFESRAQVRPLGEEMTEIDRHDWLHWNVRLSGTRKWVAAVRSCGEMHWFRSPVTAVWIVLAT